ncbi:MAG: hypothetical protein RRY99_18335 [Flavobacterium sp.]
MANYFIDIPAQSFIFNGKEYPVSKTSRIDSNRFQPDSKFYYYYEDSSELVYDVIEISPQLAKELVEIFNIYFKS